MHKVGFKSMSDAELDYYFFDCAFGREKDVTCFCASTKPSQFNIKRLSRVVATFEQRDMDILLVHLIPWTQKIFSSRNGAKLMREVLEGASKEAVQHFIWTADIVNIMIPSQGSHTIQRLLELENGQYANRILDIIVNNNFQFLATHPCANYCVRKCFENIPVSDHSTALDAVIPCASILTAHPHGAYVLQALLDNLGTKFYRIKDHVVKEKLEDLLQVLVDLSPTWIIHPHGNFTIQALISILPHYKVLSRQFVNQLGSDLVKFVLCPFGHCVVETFLKTGRVEDTRKLVKQFLRLHLDELTLCLRVRWGKFVVWKLFACATVRDRARIEKKMVLIGRKDVFKKH